MKGFLSSLRHLSHALLAQFPQRPQRPLHLMTRQLNNQDSMDYGMDLNS
jgi:hypothetical protein